MTPQSVSAHYSVADEAGTIVLHNHRVECGTRNLLVFGGERVGLRYGLSGVAVSIAFGQFDPDAVPRKAKSYHWGQRAATGALILLPGPDPRRIEDIL